MGWRSFRLLGSSRMACAEKEAGGVAGGGGRVGDEAVSAWLAVGESVSSLDLFLLAVCPCSHDGSKPSHDRADRRRYRH